MLQKQEDIGFLLKVISDKLGASCDSQLKKKGMTISQVRVIEFLVHNNNSATQKQIEDFLEVSHPAVTGLVERLNENGFVTYHTDEKNRHNKIVTLTSKAIAEAHVLNEERNSVEAKLVKNLTDDEIASLRKSLFVLYENIRSI